ncbi:MAG: LapA family protein [Acidimicrobiia bacterium]|nr:LapA family protein [Acidimicrobiia bacterium]
MSDDIIRDGESTVRADDVGRRKARPTARHIVGLVLIGVLVLVAILNRRQVPIDLVFTTVHVSLVVVIALSGLVGFAAGWFFFRRREKRRSRA